MSRIRRAVHDGELKSGKTLTTALIRLRRPKAQRCLNTYPQP